MTITIFQIAALTTALLWALSTIFSTVAVKHLGSFAFNRYRLAIASVMLVSLVLVTGRYHGFDWTLTSTILVSGFVGIFLGDAVLFASFARLGARRTSVLYAMNAPMTVFLGWVFLGETMTWVTIMGIATAIFGVSLAIVFGKRKDQISTWEEITPPLWFGLFLGLAGALGQSVGSIVIRPVMDGGADPIMVATIRVGIAAISIWIISAAFPKSTAAKSPMNGKVLSYLVLTAFAGMVIGMTLLMFAFSGGRAGIIATLSATTPVMVLPMIWFTTRERPAMGAWVGAGLVVCGTGLIFMG